ncbi:hypothetical protein DPV78_010432 [Talaromyces pinophilus]|nr:hypothetical protein DPV78_010432 [Talaromyces pinophilus]
MTSEAILRGFNFPEFSGTAPMSKLSPYGKRGRDMTRRFTFGTTRGRTPTAIMSIIDDRDWPLMMIDRMLWSQKQDSHPTTIRGVVV